MAVPAGSLLKCREIERRLFSPSREREGGVRLRERSRLDSERKRATARGWGEKE